LESVAEGPENSRVQDFRQNAFEEHLREVIEKIQVSIGATGSVASPGGEKRKGGEQVNKGIPEPIKNFD